MKAVDFKGTLSVNGQIEVPPEIASQVPKGKRFRSCSYGVERTRRTNGATLAARDLSRPTHRRIRSTNS